MPKPQEKYPRQRLHVRRNRRGTTRSDLRPLGIVDGVLQNPLGQFRHIGMRPRQIVRVDAVRQRAFARLGQRPLHEIEDLLVRAEGGLDPLPFRHHVLRMDGALGEDGLRLLLLFRGILPIGLQFVQLLERRITDIQLLFGEKHQLSVVLLVLLEERGLHDRERDAPVIDGDSHRHTQRVADGLRLLGNDAKDKSVHGIVLSVHERTANARGLLPETIHSALPLLMSGRVPEKVVMHDGIVIVLEVDTLGQAIRGNENVLRILRGIFHRRRTGLRIVIAGNGNDGVVLEDCLELFRHILRRLDEPAEDNRAKWPRALQQLVLQKLHQRGQLGIIPAGQKRLSLFAKLLQRLVALQDNARGDVRRLGLVEVRHAHPFGQCLLVGRLQPIGECLHSGSRRGRCAAQQAQGCVPVDVVLIGIAVVSFEKSAAEFQHVLEKVAPGPGQPVGAFGDFPLREGFVVSPFSQIGATALDEILAQLLTKRPMRLVGILAFRKRHELRSQQRQQVAEADRAPRMGRGRREDHVPVRVLGKLLDELPAPLTSASELGAGVRLVHNHELGSRLQERRHMLVVLDVVERNDCERIVFEDGEIGVGNLPLQLGRRRRRDRLGLDVEVPRQFGDPLVDERRRTQDASPLDFAAVQQFAQDEA